MVALEVLLAFRDLLRASQPTHWLPAQASLAPADPWMEVWPTEERQSTRAHGDDDEPQQVSEFSHPPAFIRHSNHPPSFPSGDGLMFGRGLSSLSFDPSSSTDEVRIILAQEAKLHSSIGNVHYIPQIQAVLLKVSFQIGQSAKQ